MSGAAFILGDRVLHESRTTLGVISSHGPGKISSDPDFWAGSWRYGVDFDNGEHVSGVSELDLSAEAGSLRFRVRESLTSWRDLEVVDRSTGKVVFTAQDRNGANHECRKLNAGTASSRT